MTMNTSVPVVTVCVCTYKRPALLEALLKSLVAQTVPLSTFEVVVVDNDSQESARHIAERFALGVPQLRLRYFTEKKPGISFARNSTVHHATGEFLAFIDDDETASDVWLENLTRTIRDYSFDAVMGPVFPIFPDGSPQWTRKSGFFERRRHPDGSQVSSDDGRTSNAMVRADVIKSRVPLPFDPRFAKSGGEDHDFFQWMESQGYKLGWADFAVVSEIVPKERQALSFMLERSFRQSTVYWRGKYRAFSFTRKCIEVAKGILGSIVYAIAGGLGLLTGLDRAVRYWVKSAKGLGRLFALTQVNLEGY